MNRRTLSAGIMLATLTLGACRKKPVSVDPVPMTPSTAGATEDAAAAARRAREALVRDSVDRARSAALATATSAEIANLRTMVESVVYFEYDADAITGDGRATLDAKLPILRANTALRVRVAGHTDTRGSDEYNLALGLRRAAATRKYLVDRGIAASRVDIVSFGEERPSMSGEDESSYARNRRAEFEILGGGETLRVPPR